MYCDLVCKLLSFFVVVVCFFFGGGGGSRFTDNICLIVYSTGNKSKRMC